MGRLKALGDVIIIIAIKTYVRAWINTGGVHVHGSEGEAVLPTPGDDPEDDISDAEEDEVTHELQV